MTKDHDHWRVNNGPSMPLRYGSARTEVCRCGAWRMVTGHNEAREGWDWRTDDLEAAIAQAEVDNDEC